MPFRSTITLLGCLSVISTPTLAQDIMYCVESASTGFAHIGDGDYMRKDFRPDRFTVKRREHGVTISQRGNDFTFACEGEQAITCSDGVAYSFTYNPRNKRFVYSKAFAYAFTDDDDVSVSIGTCSDF